MIAIGRVALAAAGLLAGAAIGQEVVSKPSVAVPPKVTAERVAAGSAIFNGRSCVFCHAVGGRGDGPAAPNLADAEWLHSAGDFPGIRRTIVWGVEEDEMKAPHEFEMFPRGGLVIDDEAVAALAAYVWTLSRPDTNAFVAAQARFIDRVREGRVAEATALFRREAAPLLPAEAFPHLARSLGPKQAPAAIALLEFAAERYPASAEVHAALGDAQAAAGDKARAARSYRRALEIDPANEKVKAKLQGMGI